MWKLLHLSIWKLFFLHLSAKKFVIERFAKVRSSQKWMKTPNDAPIWALIKSFSMHCSRMISTGGILSKCLSSRRDGGIAHPLKHIWVFGTSCCCSRQVTASVLFAHPTYQVFFPMRLGISNLEVIQTCCGRHPHITHPRSLNVTLGKTEPNICLRWLSETLVLRHDAHSWNITNRRPEIGEINPLQVGRDLGQN